MSAKIIKHLSVAPRDERGNVAITFALMLLPICGIMGLAVDYSTAIRVQGRLQASVDAAALAAVNARNSSDQQRLALAESVFRNNFSPDSPSTAPEPNIVINGSAVTVSSTANVATSFSSLYGVEDMPVDASSHADVANSGKKLEVGLMVDLTGSMGEYRNGEAKITSLKTAAGDLLDILLPKSGANDSLVKIGVAPFADYVNAGEFASSVTGLASSGSYTNLANLKDTKNGVFTGIYASGTIGNTAGSQSGATSATTGSYAVSSGTTTTGGGTYSSGHCDVPTVTTTQTSGGGTPTFETSGSYPIGRELTVSGTTAPPSVFTQATNSNRIRKVTDWQWNSWQEGLYYTSGYFLKVPDSTTGLTWATDSSSRKIGLKVNLDGYNTYAHAAMVKSSASNPIREIYRWKNGAWEYMSNSADTSGNWYVLVPTTWTLPTVTTTQTTTKTECTTSAQSAGQLISCVSEREGSEAYTDAAPGSSKYLGSYNHGSTSKSNYSSDGKCYVAGRELPKVIPLTSSRSTIESFFTDAKVGGGTPGHIATAWAWYLVSPLWNATFGTTAAEYTDTNTTKAVILMTDGEYNIHYASASARTQALELCTAMKAKGVKVFTIGFGFTTTSKATDNTTEGRAKDLLTQCATPATSGGSNNYYFPYDGAALRQAFSTIGSSLLATSSAGNVVRLTQ